MMIRSFTALKVVALLAASLPLWVMSLSTPTATKSADTIVKPVPVTVLSGFLGSGKTTLLQQMLQNKEGLKIGIVVNDVAEVNIDSKLVAREDSIEKNADHLVQLSNGCACCSLGDELMVSVRQLLTISELRNEQDQFDHIVVEMSGVADPKQVRAKFQEAFANMRMMDKVKLDTMVTMVDTSTYRSHLESTKIANRKEAPELFSNKEGEEPEDLEKELSKKLDPVLVGAVMAGVQAAQDENDSNAVADLLVTQTETADLVVLNKEDLVDEDEIATLKEMVGALNPRADIITSSFGKLPIADVLARAGGTGIADYETTEDHRDFVKAAGTILEVDTASHHSHAHDHSCDDPECSDSSHSHSHDHSCDDPGCTDSSHSHSHDHACDDPTCTDSSHAHSHDHSAEIAAVCDDPNCTDESHAHSHDHICDDEDCTDSSHSHSHDHATKTSHEGIGSFVYKARRPFHPARLASFLQYLPVIRGIPTEGELAEDQKVEITDGAKEALENCLRSKGFVWSADSHEDALYWSHAGASFEMSRLGTWWATLPREFWPEGTEETVLPDFDRNDHDDFSNDVGVGDRRQEVVFIGTGLGGGSRQEEIRDALSQCLLDDVEYNEYNSMKKNECKLKSRFTKVIQQKEKGVFQT